MGSCGRLLPGAQWRRIVALTDAFGWTPYDAAPDAQRATWAQSGTHGGKGSCSADQMIDGAKDV
ncbi:hypothetical protein SGFS_017730 [Streptomyces graminofaciens]|uniref:Uncharacterized protein n=1 Tax=Streptomyces graminofaciens TaxID=68212 RepID=A0ABN5VBD6_9ACTN|nr:hypothetical protein SGFS_017730 [Streptomyces graminofaciens]